MDSFLQNWRTGVVWITCGLLWCFYQLFGVSFWRHPFTAEDLLVSKWCSSPNLFPFPEVKVKVKVTYDQVWWPILRICALDLTHPKCTHTAVNTHTQQWTHTRSSGQPFMLRRPGSSWGFGVLLKSTSVVVLKVEESAVHSLYINLWVTSPTL